jgi:nucleoid DNA-binding protein
MTKNDLIALISVKTGISQRKIKPVIKAFFEVLAEQVVKGHHITIRGFGTFKTKLRASRPGRVVKTGEVVQIPARRMPVFELSRCVRSKIEAVVERKLVENG